MPAPGMSYKKLRRNLDDLGYYQPLVPESVPLVEALFHDLMNTTHNLKICKEQQGCHIAEKPKSHNEGQKSYDQRSEDNVKIINLKKKIEDLDLLHKESLEVIRNLQLEVEERNRKILKLELSQKAQIVTVEKTR